MITNSSVAGKKKSPLDVLEDILEDSKKSASGANIIADSDAAVAKEEEKLVGVRKQQKEQAQEDQIGIQRSLQEIANLKNSPQAKVADNQDQAKVQKKQDHDEKMKGIEIVQLGHKKIEVSE